MFDTKQTPSQEQNQHPQPTIGAAGEDIDDELIRKWRANDKAGLYDALDDLERAIALEDPELKLKKMELDESIEYMEKSKHLLAPNVIKHVIVPLCYAWILYKFSSFPIGSKITRALWALMDIHFWIFVVWAPIVFLQWKRMYRKKEPIPKQIQHVNQEYIQFSSWPRKLNWEDPKTGTGDHVLFLSEYWASAVKGVAVVPLLKLLLLRIQCFDQSLPHFECFLKLWSTFTQVVTRLAAVASLYQFPEMMFRLQRSNQPRPMGFFPTVMQTIVPCMLNLAPLGLISDFSKFLALLPIGSVHAIYGTFSLLLLGTWTRMKEIVLRDPGASHELTPPERKTKRFYILCYVLLWRKQLLLLGTFLGRRISNFFTSVIFGGHSSLAQLCFLYLLIFPLLGPAIHIKAIGKVFKVVYSNDLPGLVSVGANTEDAMKRMAQRAWRFYISWREPRRLEESRRRLVDKLLYLVFCKGRQLDRQAKEDNEFFEEEFPDQSILGMVAREQRVNSGAFYKHSPETWKAKAMAEQAEIHKANYEKLTLQAKTDVGGCDANMVTDPLGMVLWRGFGIGLGLSFSVKKNPLKDGEIPSSRWLQIDAAERAVIHHENLRDAEVAIEEMEMDLDPQERERRKIEREKSNEKEINYIAMRLTDLIPTTYDESLFDDTMFKFLGDSPVKMKKISENHYLMLKEDPINADIKYDDEYASPIERRFRVGQKKSKYGPKIEISSSVADFLNEANTTDTDNTSSKFTVNDDETKNESSDDNEDDNDPWEPEIVFV